MIRTKLANMQDMYITYLLLYNEQFVFKTSEEIIKIRIWFSISIPIVLNIADTLLMNPDV